MSAQTILRRSLIGVTLFFLANAGLAMAMDSQLRNYVENIRPLLAERCFSCHGGLKQEAGLRIDTVFLMADGGDSGSVITKGEPDKSLIIERVTDAESHSRMPPAGEGEVLSTEQVAMLRDWIEAGCPAPPNEKPEADPREHWAFQRRLRPAVPQSPGAVGAGNPIDAFLGAVRTSAGVSPQPEAPRHILVRRLFVDLIGLPPQPEQLAAIEADTSSDWYERLVDTLLADPRHGERWARHWMDVWRYADWWGLGEQHRYSQKHMWHFRDWIVESLNADVGYDEMVRQMLAADELYPDDPAKLRATGFLARNWFLFNRTPWLDETVEHIGKGLLGLTMNCAKCHDHKYDPITQEDYYRFRAFFEPIETRVDVVAGESDLTKDGIPRVFDGHLDRPTYLFIRGDDMKPDTSRAIEPGVPQVLAFCGLGIRPVSLPKTAFEPQRRPWVIEAHLATAARAVAEAEAEHATERSLVTEQSVAAARASLAAVEMRAAAMRAAWAAEDASSQAAENPLGAAAVAAAKAASEAEKAAAVAAAWVTVARVSAKLTTAVVEKKNPSSLQAIEKELAVAHAAVDAAAKAAAEPGEAFTPFVGATWTATRFQNSGKDDPSVVFPPTSTGRRAALAHWITDPRNPLTARVAANHIWMRHLGKPLVTTVFEYGRKGHAPLHPELLDWLASELVEGPDVGQAWSMKHLHRLILTSAAYRMDSSTKGAAVAQKVDPDNRLFWRREPIRLESQAVRDAILALAGTLESTIGGPPVPESQQAASRRRSLYFWHSDISRNLFLKTFDEAGVTECYQRDQSIVPQQALALSNAALVHDSAVQIARRIQSTTESSDEAAFLENAFVLILHRRPSPDERAACEAAMARWRANGVTATDAIDPVRIHTIWALLNHNDFVTLR